MKKKLRYLYIFVCIAVLAVSLFKIGSYLFDYFKGQNTYKEAESQFGLASASSALLPSTQAKPDTSETPSVETEATEVEETDPLLEAALDYFKDCDFHALQDINEDIIGWIVIPEPDISYPVVLGTDNSYYLEHTFDKKYSRVGSIFMDYRIQNPFEEKNTVLYGHHMRDKSMFAKLMNYQLKEAWDKNPYVYICTPTRVYLYEIYSAFRGDPMGLSYLIGFTSEKDTTDYINYTLKCGNYDTGITPDLEDKFLTLSTCTGNGHAQRMIVHARLYGSIERKNIVTTDEN